MTTQWCGKNAESDLTAAGITPWPRLQLTGPCRSPLNGEWTLALARKGDGKTTAIVRVIARPPGVRLRRRAG
jgi:hypothetical protein